MLPLLFGVCFLVVDFCLRVLFLWSKLFHEKSELAWNHPDNLIDNTSDVYPYQLATDFEQIKNLIVILLTLNKLKT